MHDHIYILFPIYIVRWVIKKMNLEFAELMQKTAGRILEQITVSWNLFYVIVNVPDCS